MGTTYINILNIVLFPEIRDFKFTAHLLLAVQGRAWREGGGGMRLASFPGVGPGGE